MPFEIWLAFVAACLAILVIPGPTVMVVVGYALRGGRSTAWATVPGVVLGDFTAMTLSLLGAGAILAASATLFTILKLAGGAYLIWLGIQLWRARPTALDATPEMTQSPASPDRDGGRGMFLSAYVVTALNPKSIVFFIAFVPQFATATGPVFQQFAILEITFLVLAGLSILVWALLAGEMRARFRRPSTQRLVNRIGGSFMIGAGLLTIATRRLA
jgi:threonine/homoserine/homoserine lactone efflux protein